MTRKAFTMVELTMVLLILGVAAAAVSLRVQPAMRDAQFRDAIAGIINYDRTTRAAARQQDRRLGLVMDLAGGQIGRADETGRALDCPAFAVPSAMHLCRLMLAGQDCGEGQTVLPCSREGFMPTYALYVEGGGLSQWFVVVGMSGDVVKVSSEDEARTILAATSPRNNAR